MHKLKFTSKIAAIHRQAKKLGLKIIDIKVRKARKSDYKGLPKYEYESHQTRKTPSH
jgi:hypothetical protein